MTKSLLQGQDFACVAGIVTGELLHHLAETLCVDDLNDSAHLRLLQCIGAHREKITLARQWYEIQFEALGRCLYTEAHIGHAAAMKAATAECVNSVFS